MTFYFAPLEGLTGYIYRQAHHEMFGHIDKYFSPFISTNQHGTLKTRELNDLLPEHNRGLTLIPQLLTNNAQDFLRTAQLMREMGYSEINLNLGCPSGTVTAKNKGAGFLGVPLALRDFLDEIFEASVMEISIKTRLGVDQPEEFYDLIAIFNRYPVKELIIHPRIRQDFYKNKPNLKVFREALDLCSAPVCYNGDLFSAGDFERFSGEFPQVETVMMGRGLLTNPGLTRQLETGVRMDKSQLRAFHDRLYADYQGPLFGAHNVLHKMKELWYYMLPLFEDHEKIGKKIKKVSKLTDYEALVDQLFDEHELLSQEDVRLPFRP